MNRENSYLPKRNVLQYSSPRKKRNLKRILLISGGSLLLFLVALGIFVVRGVFFQVKDISVSGARLLGSDVALQAVVGRIAENSALAAFLGERHILFWALSDRSYGFSNPTELESVSVNVDFWERRVGILAKERDVVHIVCRPAESACYGITGEGIVFSRIPEVRGSLILRIEDTNPAPIVFGGSYFGDNSFLPNVYRTKEILDTADLTPSVMRVKDRSLYEWEAALPDGPTLYFSGFFVPADLSNIIAEIKKETEWGSLSYVDFRVEHKVFYR